MDRRTFLKTLASLGASIALPFDLATASPKEVDVAWQAATQAWGLFEVNEYGTLSYANFEPPKTRRDAYWFSGASEFDADTIEGHWSLNERIKDIYRDALIDAAENDPLVNAPDLDAIEERVEEGWAEWFKRAKGADEAAIEAAIDDWLDAEPDWCNEWEALYKTGTAQGAAYDHFLRDDPDVMDALNILVIEGDCPGSSFFAAELRMSSEEANEIAEANGWEIRFVGEGQAT
jgi:hypothetical protein